VVFQADYDEMELQKINYDVILETYSPLCHQNNVTKFFYFAPLLPNQNFWLRQYVIWLHGWLLITAIKTVKLLFRAS